ncbi:DUF4440 domain-containing protein [Yoonia sp. R2-816]|uniref:DUF4440 domain-containing protein n=1 Tax=Yoonia sp. R2-816 TaxID=3342638 RepID=UPI0037280864
MTDDETLLEDLARCERRVWQALVDGDMAADAAALDDGFLGVYPTGFADKASHIGQLADGPSVTRFALSDLRVMRLGVGYAVLSYLACFSRVGTDTPERMFVSSIWRQDGSRWVNVFSQDTPAL